MQFVFFNMYFYSVLIPKYILMINILNYSLKSEQFIYKSIIFAILLMTTTMTQVSLKTIEQNDNVGMFSICFDGNSESEFEKFLLEFKDNATYNKDFNAILLALSKIIDKGALERFFRIEGRMNDHVSALSIDSRKLRLYCLRISDQILILGNGGVKLSRTYQEDEKLSGYVMNLQTFDKVLLKAQENGIITIEKNMITDIESATFEI